jgi:hypothetical protein
MPLGLVEPDDSRETQDRDGKAGQFVARDIERNALRANLVLRAEEWRWSSLWRRCRGMGQERSLLTALPIDVPANWLERGQSN